MLTHYPIKRSVLVPFLLYVQDELGYLTDEAIQEIAGRLAITPLEVRNVISYYSMLRTKPAGKYNVQVCTNISCLLRGGEEILEHAKKKLGVAAESRASPPTACFPWKRWSALERAVGLPPCRSTTTSTKTLRRKRWTRLSRRTAKRHRSSST